MDFSKFFSKEKKSLSFEFFPPKDQKARHILEDTILSLSQIGADFVSVTDRDGGGMREETRDICETIIKKTNIPTMAHLTCSGVNQNELKAILQNFHESGVKGIMALRGDAAPGEKSFTQAEGGFQYSTELIELVAQDGRFAIGGASYPDGHPEAESCQKDWDILVEKFRKGITFSVTQCFFDNDTFMRMVDYVDKRVPGAVIVPGVLPVTNWKSVVRFCSMCDATLPEKLKKRMEPFSGDSVASRQAGIEFSIRQCEDLLGKVGAPGLHIYSLNRSTAAAEIVTSLRLNGLSL